MPPDFTPSRPELEQVSLTLPDSKLEIKNFTEYSFESHFLEPADRWTFLIGGERLSDEHREALVPGVKVQLTVNGGVQTTGYVDSIEVSTSRSGGSLWRIEGRDVLAQAVDACADPTFAFKEGSTLDEALVALFTPFGWSTKDQFIVSNDVARDIKSNAFRAKTKRSDAKGFSRRALREYKLHQLRPDRGEGVFQFASRMANRLGLWIWTTPSGGQLVCSEPDFDNDPICAIFRNRDGTTNVLDGSVKFSLAEQPTLIIADSYAKGGEFGHGRITVCHVNTTVELSDAETKKQEELVKKYTDAGARIMAAHTFPASSVMKSPRMRVSWLHDDESQDQDQLEAFVRRAMATSQRKSLVVNYTVEGHGQNTESGFTPWTVDTTVRVQDQLAGLEETLYVLGRTFNKSRSGGTTTRLELIRLHTLEFSDGGSK